VEIDYLTVLHVRLGVKIRDLHTKDSYSFYNRLIIKNCHEVYIEQFMDKIG
jgi:hypothetical protein